MLLSNLSNTPFPPVVVNSSKSYSEWRSSLYILGLRFIYILNASVTNGQMDDLILKEIKNLSIDHNIAIPIVNSPHSELLYYLSGWLLSTIDKKANKLTGKISSVLFSIAENFVRLPVQRMRVICSFQQRGSIACNRAVD